MHSCQSHLHASRPLWTDIMAEMTTISLRRETKELLRKFGSKGQTDDEIMRWLIEMALVRELDRQWDRILAEEGFTPLDEL